MKTQDFYKMLKQCGVPVAYSAFKNETAVPYIVYTERREVYGDDFKARIIGAQFRIELYADERDRTLETKIENLLDENGFEYEAEYGIYIEDDQTFMTVYDVGQIYYKK